MDQDHSQVKKLNISIDLVVYNTIIIDKIRVASSPLVENFLVTEDNQTPKWAKILAIRSSGSLERTERPPRSFEMGLSADKFFIQ